MKYFCCDYRRREDVEKSDLNGIDYLEVFDDMTRLNGERQRTLFVHFIKSLTGSGLNENNVRIEGGERVRNVAVKQVSIGAGDQDKVLTVKVDRRGDFSLYTFRLVKGVSLPHLPPDGFDRILSAVDFSFKVNCPSDFDCQKVRVCPIPRQREPDINYLAKDYVSFWQLMLDRISVLMPQWKNRHAADLGIALVELLAYVGDYLSYEQDAVATEAYLTTARRRVSVRRHARLMDYFMHDGCNSRVWVHMQVDTKKVELKKSTEKGITKFFTRVKGQPVCIPPDSPAYHQAMALRPEVFELMHDATLFQAHNDEMSFYAWGARECCLPKGATRATLCGNFPDLKVGDILIFQEVLGPRTGKKEDADPLHCHAVCLTEVLAEDEVGKPLTDPLNGQEITEIAWSTEDELPFPLCISAETDDDHGRQYVEDVSIALGNIVLADHGLTIEKEPLGDVPKPTLYRAPTPSGDRCRGRPPDPVTTRFRPKLKKKPLTHAAEFKENILLTSARAAMHCKTEDALPAIYLTTDEDAKEHEWKPKRDLLGSHRDKKEFVVEVEADGTAYLRFGDDQHGMRPATGTHFYAFYRVGNGSEGNIGAKALAHIVTEEAAIVKVSNPMPACNGADPESMEQLCQSAPSAFRTPQKRAVTAVDYAEVAGRHEGVQRAAATFRWTGSWHTVFLTIDRLHGLKIDTNFEESMRKHMECYRMAGHDVEIDDPEFVSLEIEMLVCVQPDHFRGDVKAALLEVFSNRDLPDGRRGVFHPDNFTFGQPVYISHLYKAAQMVAGVASVKITTFQHQDNYSTEAIETGKLTLGRLEIARLDNDPNFPKHGVVRIITEGGK